MPMSATEVRHALGELEDLRYAAGNLDEALRRIVEATHQLFAVDGAGLMLIDPDQLLRNIAVSDRRIDDLEELQIEHGEGPCVDAFEDKTLVDTDDLAGDARWPKFSRPRSSAGCGRCWPARFPTTSRPSGWWWCSRPRCTPGRRRGSWPWWPSPTWPP